jgi:hypothetical protein
MFPDSKLIELAVTVFVQSCIAGVINFVNELSGITSFNHVGVAHRYVHVILNISTQTFTLSGAKLISCHINNSLQS